MVEQRYPSGRVVKNVLDNNGDLSMVQSARCMDAAAGTDADCTAQAGLWNYAKNLTYNPAGAVTSMQLGNGRWESTVFNSRLQPIQIALGATPNATNLLKLDYSYGEWNGTTLDATKNNGNVAGQVITVKRPGQSDLVFDQKYGYDMLNRITSAEEKTGTTVNWNQTYTFDRYGNRNFNENLSTTLPKGCVDGSTMVVCEADKKMLNPDLNASDNRMDSGQGWAYDAVGNVIADPQGRSFIYDAENKQVEVENSLEQSIGSYWFDGDGKRIKKEGLAPNGQPELTVFVYDAGGTLIGEYSTAIETAAPKVQYLTADHLGSPRINTDQNGTVTSRTDYLPYGEEITALGGRSPNENYSPDDIRKGFTGYESDAETGLDYAQARMYRSSLGRFNGADPLLNSGRPGIPQSWNRYSYVANSPIKFTDPLGLFEWADNLKEDSSLSKSENKRRANLREKILKAYDKARAEINKAMASKKLSAEKLEKLNNALNALGPKPGEAGSDNGVTIGVGVSTPGAVGQADPTFSFEQNEGTVTGYATVAVSFSESFINSSGLFAGLVHEGSHVNDIKNYASAIPDRLVGKSSPLDLTQYQSEVNAFQTNSYLFEAMGVDGSKYKIPVWDNSWAKADSKLPPVETSRTRSIDSFISDNYKDRFGAPITSTNQGSRLSDACCTKRR